jgi:dolichol-phosphate mannosyltransferase
VKITVVVPTFNESENLPNMVRVLFALPLTELHLLVVDDNSPDGTGALADQLASQSEGRMAVLHRPAKLGLGTAYLQGFNQAIRAGAQAIGQMDADFSHPPEKLIEMVSALESCDVVLGSRYMPGGNVDEHWPAWRKGLSAFGNLYARTILGMPVRDVTGGYRLWRRETLMGLPLERVRSNGYAFQVEMTYLAYRLGYRIREIPIYFADRKWGQSKMSFAIQREAAIRVWCMLRDYRHVQPLVNSGH